jgi:anthranilate phosphoribosyltransferase
VQLNAGAAIYVAGLADDMAAGVNRAGEVIDSGAATAKLDALVQLTQA